MADTVLDSIVKKYGLPEKRLEVMKEQYKLDRRFPNPYAKGTYRAIIEALTNLGVNEWHSFATIRNEVRKIMQEIYVRGAKVSTWESFYNREPKSHVNAKDANGRLMQNIEILQRINGHHPWGLKLKQLCACIDVRKADGKVYYRLNTTFLSEEDVKPSREKI